MRRTYKFVVLTLIFSFVLSAPVAAAGLGKMKLATKIESMKKAGVGPVIFPHTKHEKAIKCAECHPKIFKEKRGTNNMTMKKNMSGQSCGFANCHNSPKAFPLFECFKCHTKAGAAK